jgi:hypothetical protein
MPGRAQKIAAMASDEIFAETCFDAKTGHSQKIQRWTSRKLRLHEVLDSSIEEARLGA